MKLNRRSLRKMILKEIKNLQEGIMPSRMNLEAIFRHSFRDQNSWRSVTHGTIQAMLKNSGMDPMTFFETVKRVGYDWQLPKVAEALSEIDPSFYDYANQELGIQRYHNTPGSKIRLPELAPNQIRGFEDDYSDYDDDDDNYPGPLVP